MIYIIVTCITIGMCHIVIVILMIRNTALCLLGVGRHEGRFNAKSTIKVVSCSQIWKE